MSARAAEHAATCAYTGTRARQVPAAGVAHRGRRDSPLGEGSAS